MRRTYYLFFSNNTGLPVSLTGSPACQDSAEFDPEEEHPGDVAIALGVKFIWPLLESECGESVPWDVDEDEWVYLQEAMLAEYCGLTEEEAS